MYSYFRLDPDPFPPSGECKKCRRFLHCLRNSETLKILRLHSKGNSCRRRLHSEAEKLPDPVAGFCPGGIGKIAGDGLTEEKGVAKGG